MKIKLLTYNIFNGTHKDSVIKNISGLAREGVNIFCLQEVRNLGNGKSLIDLILPVLGSQWRAEKLLNEVGLPNDLGLCVMWDSSVARLKDHGTIMLPKIPRKDLLENVFKRINKSRYHFPVQRCAQSLDFECGGKNFRVTNIHLDVTGGKTHKTNQLAYLRKYLTSKIPIGHEVICGDFNTLGWGLLARRYKSKMADFFGSGFKNIFPKMVRTGPLYQHLDHIFIKGFSLVKAEVKRLEGSDHFPIMAELEIN